MEHEPRSSKGRSSRTRLLASARDVFEEQGFLTATVSDITAAAEMSHGSFYHYFPSKEAIFREIAESVTEGLLELQKETDGVAGTDPLEKIRAGNRSYLLSYQQEARIMRVIEEVSRYDDQVRAVRLRSEAELARRLEISIARLQSQDRADGRLDGRYTAVALGGMVARFAEQLFLDGGPYDLEESVEQLTRLWANALGLSLRCPA